MSISNKIYKAWNDFLIKKYESKIYDVGYEDGETDGYSEGYKDGYTDGLDVYDEVA